VIIFFGLVIFAAFCAIMAVRAVRLLYSALWLTGVSIAVSIMFYLVSATIIAVIELSLSVGLITILLVFAISMVGADSPDQPVQRRLNVPIVAAMLLLVIGLTVPLLAPQASVDEVSFSETFWQQREADVIVQIALIFAGVLGVLGLLADVGSTQPSRTRVSELPQPAPKPETVIVEKEPELERV
jgi:NADH:ubiquinone oxidoreductase subunit 6 (subunit J)